MSRVLIITGLILVIIGLALHWGGKVPGLGKLPGDILIKKENTTFYFPITTCLLLSLLLSIILAIWKK